MIYVAIKEFYCFIRNPPNALDDYHLATFLKSLPFNLLRSDSKGSTFGITDGAGYFEVFLSKKEIGAFLSPCIDANKIWKELNEN